MDKTVPAFFRSGAGCGLSKETADKILEDLKSVPDGEDVSPLIAESGSPAYLFSLSEIRSNPAKFLNPGGDERVLEIGGGCGTVTGYFARHASEVTSVIFSGEDARVNAFRNRRFSNVTLCTGLPDDVLPRLEKTYDLITLFGVCEYAQLLTESSGCAEDACLRLLNLASEHLAEGGRIAITTPNRLGLKFFAGNRDVTGHYFDSLERRSEDGAVSFSRSEWARILSKAGFSNAKFYYPYPDERFPLAVYSDAWMPSKGELCSNNQNFDSVRLYLFDETRVFDAITEEKLLPEMANGFLILAGADSGAALYEKFSNERAPQFCVNTRVEINTEQFAFTENETPELLVRKFADGDRSADHLRRIPRYEKKLEALYRDTNLLPNRSVMQGGVLNLEYVTGVPYDRIVDEALRQSGREAALKTIEEFIHLILDERKFVPFRMTEEFAALFGTADDFPQEEQSLPVSDLDMIMPNVIRTGEDSYTLIDYEWTVEFPVPVRFLIYRVIHYYLAAGGARAAFSEQDVLTGFGITAEDAKRFAAMEESFQSRIMGEHVPLVTMYPSMSPGNFFVRDCLDADGNPVQRGSESEDIRILRAEVERLRNGYDELLDLYETSQNELAKQKAGG